MALLKFSETLKNKRHELGLTISQASSVLKLKEQVLIAFEEGDFENMPKSGYAQGMLASYARYLGLSPRELVDMYSEEYYEYVHGQSSHDLRRRTRDTRSGRIIDGYDVPNESESRPKAYVELRPYLPTAGGPMGDYGAFATTSGVHSRSTGAVVPTNTGAPVGAYSHAAYSTGHSYNTQLDSTRPSRSSGAARRRSGESGRGGRSNRSRSLYRDDIRTRGVSSSQYQDDRHTGSCQKDHERPNIDRRSLRSRSSAERDRRGSDGGLIGGIVDWLSDSRHALALVVIALGIALTLIAIFSIKSCVSNTGTEAPSTRTVGVTPAETTTDQSTENAANPAGASEQVPIEIPKPPEPTVVMVKVSVAEGQVSWLEVQCDGESSIADTVTGPWEQTYDVKTQLIVRAGDISAVSVFVNGQQQQFEMKSSGVGTITVDGPPSSAKEEVKDTEADEEKEDEDSSDTEEHPAKNEDGDEYQYTYDGFDIYIDHRNGNLYCIDPNTGAKLNPADGTPYNG